MEVGGAKAARTDPQGPPGVPYHQEYVRWADATRLTPPCHKHRPNRLNRRLERRATQAVHAAGTNFPLRFSHALYSELCARAAELRIMLRMHNDGQVLLIFIECRAQLFEVDAELCVEKGPEEAQLFY